MEIWKNTLIFSGKSLIFSGLITLLGMVLSWLLYRYVVARKLDLKKALFEEQNFAAWIEFVGAFILPVFYLSAKAIQEERAAVFSQDLLMGIGTVVLLVLLFTLLRLVAGWAVCFSCGHDAKGKIDLIEEIYLQKNVAAALFSVSLAVVFANMLAQLHGGGIENILLSVTGMLEILLLSLAFFFVFGLLHRRISFLDEIFKDNNEAAGVVLLGFSIAIQILLHTAVNYREDFMSLDIVILACIAFGILLLTVFTGRLIYSKLLRLKLLDEFYKDNNQGAALGELALYIGTAWMIANFLA